MASEWFCMIKGKALGPFLPNDLKRLVGEGKLSASDFVRKGTSGEWVSASKVKGLFEGKENPVLPSPPAIPPKSEKGKRRLPRYALLTLGLLLVLALAVPFLLPKKEVSEKERVLGSFRTLVENVEKDLSTGLVGIDVENTRERAI
jgi:hypothetical protein